MKKHVLIKVLILISFSVNAQNNCDSLFNKGLDYFNSNNYKIAKQYFIETDANCPVTNYNKGAALYNLAHIYNINNDLDSAIFYSEKLINTPNTDSSLIARSYYNLTDYYSRKEMYDSSIFYYKTILGSNFNDKDKVFGDRSIGDEPYMNYHFYSCFYLAEIYSYLGDNSKAIEYLTLTETKYPFNHYSGTSIAYKNASVQTRKAYYIGLNGDLDSSYSILAPYMNYDRNFFSHQYFLMLLKKNYGKKQFYAEVNKNLKEINKNNEITLFDYKINLTPFILEEKNTTKEKLKDLQQNSLYIKFLKE